MIEGVLRNGDHRDRSRDQGTRISMKVTAASLIESQESQVFAIAENLLLLSLLDNKMLELYIIETPASYWV